MTLYETKGGSACARVCVCVGGGGGVRVLARFLKIKAVRRGVPR